MNFITSPVDYYSFCALGTVGCNRQCLGIISHCDVWMVMRKVRLVMHTASGMSGRGNFNKFLPCRLWTIFLSPIMQTFVNSSK